MPEFPHDFVRNHCPRVLEARRWRRIYDVPDLTEKDDMDYADCAFKPAGFSRFLCENCGYFILSYTKAGKFIPIIKKYYEDAKEEQDTELNNGANI